MEALGVDEDPVCSSCERPQSELPMERDNTGGPLENVRLRLHPDDMDRLICPSCYRQHEKVGRARTPAALTLFQLSWRLSAARTNGDEVKCGNCDKIETASDFQASTAYGKIVCYPCRRWMEDHVARPSEKERDLAIRKVVQQGRKAGVMSVCNWLIDGKECGKVEAVGADQKNKFCCTGGFILCKTCKEKRRYLYR
jgi:hypothetical protein